MRYVWYSPMVARFFNIFAIFDDDQPLFPNDGTFASLRRWTSLYMPMVIDSSKICWMIFARSGISSKRVLSVDNLNHDGHTPVTGLFFALFRFAAHQSDMRLLFCSDSR